ncbi:RNA polymerase sigma factor [Parapedobacter tibetensis]|uniref:RNA polymerase sigma factor n=1 Tax=Parapedobacter tibetensis TaxID=2972951 RepID=UPI00214DCC71|nr:RNA polymerase sigma-70 factor [Parapedobacter tibetensis]
MLSAPKISSTDSELVGRVAAGDHAAYTAVYNRYGGLLYVHAWRKLNNREAAKDLVQELFTSLWVNRGSLRPDIVLPNYLYAAVRYKIIKYFARKKRETAYLDTLKEVAEYDGVMPDHAVREQELQRLIEQEVGQLPPKMRTVFQMSRQQYLSHREIAEGLDISEATVKKQVNNALKVLRVKLGTLLVMLSIVLH